MSAAIFAYNGVKPRLGGNLSGLPQIFELLREREVDPLISLGGETAYQEDGIQVHMLSSCSVTIATEGLWNYHQAGLMVNRLNRTLEYDQMGSAALRLAVINENATRNITNEKHRVYDEVFHSLNIGMPTALLSSLATLRDFAGENPAESYIIKPNRGSCGRGIVVVAREDLDEVDETTLDGSKIIQPRHDFTGQLPANLKPYDTASADLFEDVKGSTASKELRVYGFHSPQRTDVFAVGRAIKDEVSEWFFVDPDTLPAEIYTQTEAAIKSTALATGAVAMYGALDFGYGNLASEDPAWHVVELNSKQPYMIGYDKHTDIAHRLRVLFADQIRSTVIV